MLRHGPSCEVVVLNGFHLAIYPFAYLCLQVGGLSIYRALINELVVAGKRLEDVVEGVCLIPVLVVSNAGIEGCGGCVVHGVGGGRGRVG